MQEVVKIMYILVESDDTSSLSMPLKTTNRIKFLSFAASEKFIVFGASSGGLYVYNRESFSFKSLVPSKEGPVTCVMISPDEKWFGFSTARGVSCILEHNGSAVNRRILSHIHEGHKVTALKWNNNSNQLYVGDDSGQISVISVSSYLTPAAALMQLDSSVVQLDTCSYMLLASTTTRSYLCDTFREQYRQIGSRLRDGEFGACFYHVDSHESCIDPQDYSFDNKDSHGPFSSTSDDGEWLLTDKHFQNVKLFCARPGLRLWEVRVDGAVLSTHQYKQLRSTPPAKVVQPPEVGLNLQTSEPFQGKHLLQFSKLFRVSTKFIMTYDSNGLCVLDAMTSEVILWTDHFKNIIDMCVVGEVLYLWMGDSKLHAVSLSPIDKFLICMYLQKKYSYCARFCAAHVNLLKKIAKISLRMHVLTNLLEKIMEEEEEEGNQFDETTLSTIRGLLEEVSKNAQIHAQAQMLNSGIFIVGNAHLLSQKEEFQAHKPQLQPMEKLDFFPDILGNQDEQPTAGAKQDSLNGVFKKSILPSISSLPLLTEQSNRNSEEDYDPFPDLPLSSLTSAETIMALKNITSSVSGTISSSTKTLKEKWQNFEEKFRGQEGNSLTVEKCSSHSNVESSNLYESNYDNSDYKGEENKMVVGSRKQSLNLPVSPFMDKCSQIASNQSDNRENLQELELEMLSSFAVLYNIFRQALVNESEICQSGVFEDTEPCSGFEKWLEHHDIVPFPFYDHFTKEFVATLKCHFQSCLKSGSLLKWVSQFTPNIKLDYSLFPSHICQIYSEESLLMDQAVGRTLESCKVLLSPHSALQCLDESGSPCHYFSWNVIMDHFHSSPLMLSPNPTEKHSDSWPLPWVLNAMQVMLQLGQIESCRNLGKYVPIRHVLRTMLKLGEDSVQTYRLLLLYLEKVPGQELLTLLKDLEVYYFGRYAYENLQKSNSHDHCVCGYPLTGVKYQQAFSHVGQSLLSCIYQTQGLSEALAFCQKTGVLWYHLIVLRRKEPLTDVLPLILHLACEEELKYRSRELSLPLWDLVFQLRARLQEGYCLQCNAQFSKEFPSEAMSWTSLGSLLLTEASLESALALLSKHTHSMPPGSLSQQFYQSCLLASVTESNCPELKTKLLNAFTDCTAVPVMSPHLAGMLGVPHGPGRHHWGLHLQPQDSHCLHCLLPLASASAGSFITFYCRHSFHSICLEQQLFKQCPVCTK